MLGDAVLYRGEQVDHGAALEKLCMTPAPYPEGAAHGGPSPWRPAAAGAITVARAWEGERPGAHQGRVEGGMVAGRRDGENVGEEGGGSFHPAPRPGNHEGDGAVRDALDGHADAALEDCVCAVQVCGSAQGGSVGGDRGVACDWAEAPMV